MVQQGQSVGWYKVRVWDGTTRLECGRGGYSKVKRAKSRKMEAVHVALTSGSSSMLGLALVS